MLPHFLDELKFQEEIESMVVMHRITHFEAVLLYLKENQLDAEEIKKIISPRLKAKIYADAMMDGLVKKEPTLDC